MAKPVVIPRESAEMLAIQALSYLAQEPQRLDRFLALSGISSQAIREAAGEPGFLAGVLDHLAGDEALLTGFAGEAGVDAAEVMRARTVLAMPDGNEAM